MNTLIVIAVYAVILVLLSVGVYMILRNADLKEAAQKNLQKIMSDLHSRNDKKVDEIEKARRKYGTTSGSDVKQNIASKFYEYLDGLLIHSEVSLKYEWMNAAVYILLSIFLALIGILLGGVLTGSLGIGVGLAFFFVMYPYVRICSKANMNYKKTESQLKYFINAVATNAVHSSDLMTILEITAAGLEQPLQGAIYRAINTSRVSGEVDAYIWRLTREIEHPLFVNFIRNLDICSKTDANYRDVARDFSTQADMQLDSLEKIRAILNNERNEILLLVVIGLGLSYISCSLAETNLIEVFHSMTTSPVGILILVAEIIMYGSTAVYLIVGGKR